MWDCLYFITDFHILVKRYFFCWTTWYLEWSQLLIALNLPNTYSWKASFSFRFLRRTLVRLPPIQAWCDIPLLCHISKLLQLLMSWRYWYNHVWLFNTEFNRRVSQMRAPIADCREPAGSYNRQPEVLDVFEHKTQYPLIYAPYTHIVVYAAWVDMPP